MPYFLCPVPLAPGAEADLAGEEAEHLLKSRRLRAGETFALQDPAGARFTAEVIRADRRSARVRAIAPLAVPPLPALRLTLLLAAVKDKALELALQKATEVGVAQIVVFPAQHSPVADEALAHEKTRARWERILREACKQCERQFPPALHLVDGLPAALPIGMDGGRARGFMLHPGAPRSLAEAAGALEPGGSAAVLIGPEGGFTPEEVAQAEGAGYQAATLGGLILRAETAALAACAVLLLGR